MNISLDFAQTYADIVGYIGFFIALVGWIYQWRKRQDDKKQELRSIWENISIIKTIMAEIESGEEQLGKNKAKDCKDLPHEVYQAHAELAILLKNTFARAIAREKNVTLKTIIKWRKSGKLSSDWQQKCAMDILLTDELIEDELENLDEKYSTWDAIDHSNSPLRYRSSLNKPE